MAGTATLALALTTVVGLGPAHAPAGAERETQPREVALARVAAAAQALPVERWPGGQSIRKADAQGELGTDLSGLSYRAGATEADDVIWGVDDRAGAVVRLVERSGTWRRDTADGWSRGKTFTFPDGRVPDAEGIVVHGGYAWVATERDDTDVSRNSILRVPLGGTSTTLGAAREWKLNHEFARLGPNAGLESIDFVPDAFLVNHGFHDSARGKAYDPAAYPRKVGGGVFFVAAEQASTQGEVRGYVLLEDGSVVRVATVANPVGNVRALEFDAHGKQLWMVCDDDCDGRSATARIRDGRFVATHVYARPTGLPNHNNEGFTVTPGSRCEGGRRPVFWANDSNNEDHALRSGTLPCGTERASASVRLSAGAAEAGRAARVAVTVAAATTPTGTVTVTVGRRTRTARLQGGRATLRLGAFATPGPRPVDVHYAGDTATDPARASGTLRVRKAATVLTPRRSRLTVSRGSRARIVATLRANGLRTSGAVRVRVGGRPVRAQVRRPGGDRLVVRTPVLRRAGTHTVVVRYLGTKATAPRRATVTVVVR